MRQALHPARPIVAFFLIAQVVFLVVLAARELGWLQALEFPAYDLAVRWRATRAPDPNIVLIEETEEDLRRWGFPLSDAILARALDAIEGQRPAVVGVDKYRDIPFPPGDAAFANVLRENDNIVWIYKFGGGRDEVPPPAQLRGSDRIGFNDLVEDRDGKVRRGLLFLDDGKRVGRSFGLVLALRYLKTQSVGLSADPKNPDSVRLGRTTIRAFEPDDGSYVHADAGGYQFLLDFADGGGPYPTYRLTELLESKIPPGALAGKIVIMGSSAVSLHDFFSTPVDSGRGDSRPMAGGELQARVVAQLLRVASGVTPIRTASDRHEYLALWLWCLAGAAIGALVRTMTLFLLGLVIGTAVPVAAFAAAFAAGWWISLLPALVGFAACAGLAAAHRAHRERAERGTLMQIFSRHVSPTVANALWTDRASFMEGGRPKPQHVFATVLFTDIRGFTSVSEKLAPAELLAWLNEYFELMTQAVIDNGGVINKYIGDAIMALFGVPIPRDTEASRAADAISAVKCAVTMADSLQKLNERYQSENRPPIGMRVGIHSGSLVAGSVGGGQRLEYTVIGDTVNIASRLESYRMENDFEACRILVSETTHDFVKDGFHSRPIGALALKGKEISVNVFQVLGRRV